MKLLLPGKEIVLPYLKKVLIIMKLTAFLILWTVLHASANTYSQKVSIEGKNLTLPEVFKSLRLQTGFQFIYMQDVIKESKPVTLKLKNVELAEVLNVCLSHQKLSFEITEKIITIKPTTITDGLNHQLLSPSLITPPITVRGRIKNEKGENVLASIIIKGTKRGTTTDESGSFELKNVDEGAILLISGTGIETTEIAASENMFIITKLKINVEDEVVINKGYYTEKQRLSTGNVTRIDAKQIENQPVTSPLLALQGRVPGLEISPSNGIPGSAPTIQIRGRNSLRNNNFLSEVANSPLYVIDGVPIDPTPLYGNSLQDMTSGYDPLSSINPNNIERIDVLKDADATAIYGSRGANGVILITTKRSSRSDKTTFDVNAYTGGGKIVNKVKLMNTQQYLTMRNEAFTNDGATPGIMDFDVNGTWDTTRYTDWQEELLGHTSHISDLQASISGGANNTSFRFGGGCHKETTIFSNDFGFKAFTGNFNLNHTSSNKKFTANLTVNYGWTSSKTFESNSFLNQALQLPPHAPALYDENGDLNWAIKNLGGGFLTSTFSNPHAQLRNTNQMSSGNLVANAVVSYELFRGLTLKSNFGFTDLNSNEVIKFPLAAVAPTNIFPSSTGMAKFSSNQRKSWIVEPQLNYSTTINNHNFNFLIGGSYQQSRSALQLIEGYGYLSDILLTTLQGATTSTVTIDRDNRFKYLGTYLRLGYNFQEKYVLNLSGRRDGSSRFGPGKKFGNFGAIGAAWIFSNENFLKGLENIISFGKIRVSYGVTGNDQIGDYRYFNTYAIAPYTYARFPTLKPNALFNPNFSWETTRKFESGIELGFFDNRVVIELSRYSNRSPNQLVEYALPTISGFPSVLKNFEAVVGNRGMEAIVRIQAVRKKDIDWLVSFNIARNSNKLIAFPNLESSSYGSIYKIGESLNSRRVYTYKGVNPETGEYEFVDVNNNGYPDAADKKFSVPNNRKFYGGLINTFRYKTFEISMLFQFTKQIAPNYIPTSPPATRNVNMPVDILNRWQKTGDIAEYAKYSFGFPTFLAHFNVLDSDRNIIDRSFIRLKTFSAAYAFPEKLEKKLGGINAKIFLQGQNLLTFSDYIGFDPETGVSMPPLKMITVGINVKL